MKHCQTKDMSEGRSERKPGRVIFSPCRNDTLVLIRECQIKDLLRGYQLFVLIFTNQIEKSSLECSIRELRYLITWPVGLRSMVGTLAH